MSGAVAGARVPTGVQRDGHLVPVHRAHGDARGAHRDARVSAAHCDDRVCAAHAESAVRLRDGAACGVRRARRLTRRRQSVSTGSNCLAAVPTMCDSGQLGWNYPNLQSNPGYCVLRFNPPTQCFKLVLKGPFDANVAQPFGYDVAGNLVIAASSNSTPSVRAAYVDGPFVNVLAKFGGAPVYVANFDYFIQAIGEMWCGRWIRRRRRRRVTVWRRLRLDSEQHSAAAPADADADGEHVRERVLRHRAGRRVHARLDQRRRPHVHQRLLGRPAQRAGPVLVPLLRRAGQLLHCVVHFAIRRGRRRLLRSFR